MLIYCKRIDLLTCTETPQIGVVKIRASLLKTISPLGKTVSVKCLSKLEDGFNRRIFELHESPQSQPFIPL